jgi:MFS superfamily sulfate permease-like transporter
MKKKYIIMLISTFVIGIIIGVLTSGVYYSKKSPRLIVAPNKEYFQQKAVRLLKLDSAQLKQFENSLNKFSEKAYLIEKESNFKMYNTLDSLYTELKPALTTEQKEKFEKKLSNINTLISK